jgi:hypothetical protein
MAKGYRPIILEPSVHVEDDLAKEHMENLAKKDSRKESQML